MNTKLKWPLILIFAAFFIPVAYATDPVEGGGTTPVFNTDPDPFVQPKITQVQQGKCQFATASDFLNNIDKEECSDLAHQRFLNSFASPYNDTGCNSLPGYSAMKYSFEVVVSGNTTTYQRWLVNCAAGTTTSANKYTLATFQPYAVTTNSEECPPEGNSNYSVIGPNPTDPSKNVCFPKYPLCPKGYFTFDVLGSGCIPVKCPAAGTASNSVRNLQGALPFGKSGTYCDGQCSYSVSESSLPYAGSMFANGVSTGNVCGGSLTYEGSYFTDASDSGSCQTYSLTNGSTYQVCTEQDTDSEVPPTEPAPPIDDKIVDETATQQPYSGIDCTTVEDKLSCVGGNIVNALAHETAQQKVDDAKRHNMLITQQKEITEYVERQEQLRDIHRASENVAIVGAVNTLGTTITTAITNQGGTGGGSGSSVDLTGIETTLTGIKESLEGSGEGGGSTGEPNPFYEPEYPNGFQDVWSKNESLLKSSAPFTFVEQFSNLSLQGQAPPMEFCFNLGNNMNYGCQTLDLDSRIFAFIYGVIMITAAFSCRRIIFGG